MPQFTVPINGANGPGSVTVNATDAASAAGNVGAGNYATGPAVSGSYQSVSQPAVGGGTPTAAAPTTVNSTDAEVEKLGRQVNSLLGAIASGNKEAFDEAIREFNLSFGLDKDKFSEAVRQFNQNYLISESGVTGTYQGQQTQQAQLQAANLAAQQAGITGYYNAPGTGVYAPGSFVKKANGEVGQIQPDGSIVSYSMLAPQIQSQLQAGWANASAIP